jgi:four helix bundle protein
MRNFRNLEVWQESIKFVTEIYSITRSFPTDEIYGLVSQINRCAVSIPSNLAEGSSRSSGKEYSRFIEIALGSSFELETQLEISKNLNFIHADLFKNVLERLTIIQKRLNALKSSIRE